MDGRRAVDDEPIYREADAQVVAGIVSIDSNLSVSACTSTATELLGRTAVELVGSSVWDLLPNARDTVAERNIDAALATERQQSFEWYDPVSHTWFDVQVHPCRGGLSLQFTELADDGGRHRHGHLLEPAEEPFGVGAWRIDLPSRTLTVSEEVLRIRGLPPDYDLSLEEGIQFYHPRDRPVLRAAVDRLEAEGETYDLELREVRGDGEMYWVRTTGVAEYDADGDIVALRGVYRDITERKENELELQRKTRELQRQNERLDRFASVLSHDLRNPLTVALGRLELARESVERDHYEAIETALYQIDTLIEDVLDLARYGAAVSDPEPVDLAAVAEECWEGGGGSRRHPRTRE